MVKYQEGPREVCPEVSGPQSTRAGGLGRHHKIWSENSLFGTQLGSRNVMSKSQPKENQAFCDKAT